MGRGEGAGISPEFALVSLSPFALVPRDIKAN